MANTSTVTVQSVINYCSQHAELMPLVGVGGYANEPGLSIASDVLAGILTPPFAWKFNRKTLTAVLCPTPARQDSLFAGASAFVLGGVGGIGIGLASNSAIVEVANLVTVNTLGPHGFAAGQTVYMVGNTVAAYNSVEELTAISSGWSGGWVITATPSTTSFQFTHASAGLSASGAPGIADFGWLEYASMVSEDQTGAPRPVSLLQAARSLQPSGYSNTFDKLSVNDTATAGVLLVRFNYVPSASNTWGVTLVYQASATNLTSLLDTFAPVPDDSISMVRQAFLAACYRYVGSARAENEFRRAQQDLAQTLASDDAESSEEYIVPTDTLMDWGW